MTEIWKDIPGYEGRYQASRIGNIRSLDRIITESNSGKKYLKKGILKKLTLGNHGYYVCPMPRISGVRNLCTVHSLIAKTFLPQSIGKNHVDHINSIRTDNRVENLEWVSQKENNKRQYHPKGSEHWASKLTHKDIVDIRNKHSEKTPQYDIAEIYGISRAYVSVIVNRKSWKHV